MALGANGWEPQFKFLFSLACLPGSCVLVPHELTASVILRPQAEESFLQPVILNQPVGEIAPPSCASLRHPERSEGEGSFLLRKIPLSGAFFV